MENKNKSKHLPVLLDKVLEYLNPQTGNSYLDLTAGYGGHARAILSKTMSPNKAVLIDRDQFAVDTLKKEFLSQGVKIINSDFYKASVDLKSDNQKFDLILADLGISSPQVDIGERGFSLKHDGPLDMRMDQSQILTADKIVNSYSQFNLAEIIKNYGEEPKAHKIAREIVNNRPINTTYHLATVVARTNPMMRQKIHPATKTFQALRIAVNDEINLLKLGLPIWIDLLAPNGRIVVISFHSLEDRIVKNVFREYGGNNYDSMLKILTKQPITSDDNELVFNPRARSAKLRAAVKIKR